VRSLAPVHGQHTLEILREADYSDEEIASFLARRIVLQNPA
jgi:hypothetical protein